MNPLTLEDVVDIARYEKIREEFRRKIIAVKADRRIQIGDMISMVFENRDTLTFQVQEMMRAERIADEKAIQAELDVYNTLMPNGSDLSATCFIEITDKARIQEILDHFIGLDRPGAMTLELGESRKIQAVFEPGRSEEDRISSVHYVRFPFEGEDAAWWRSGEGEASISVNLPHYSHTAPIPGAMRQALAADLD